MYGIPVAVDALLGSGKPRDSRVGPVQDTRFHLPFAFTDTSQTPR
jgi:hypothetical protein